MIFNLKNALNFDIEAFMQYHATSDKDKIKHIFNNFVNVLEENGVTNCTVKKPRNERLVYVAHSVALVSYNHDSEACGIFVSPDPNVGIVEGTPHPVAHNGAELIEVWADGVWGFSTDAPWLPAVERCLRDAADALKRKVNHVPERTANICEEYETQMQKAKQDAISKWKAQ